MPPSLGQKLKQTRELQGLSLADVSHKLRIPIPRLQDLEDDNYNTFGSLTYARSFLHTYGGFLGVDVNPVTDRLAPSPLGGARDYRYLTQSLGRWISSKPGDSLMPDARPVRSSNFAMALVAVLGVVLVGGALWAKAYYLTDRKAPVLESKVTPSRHEVAREHSGSDEEIRPAVPNRTPTTDNVPIRRALPVEDDAGSKRKK
jgi:cytoskeletal protein RodZ